MATAQLQTREAPFTIAPITYEVQKEMIAKLADEYLPLTVADINDRDGIVRVHAARMNIKNLRLKIEKGRKELKSDALEYGKRVDTAARELPSLLQPIELHLENEESIVERENQRLAQEAEARKQAMI